MMKRHFATSLLGEECMHQGIVRKADPKKKSSTLLVISGWMTAFLGFTLLKEAEDEVVHPFEVVVKGNQYT